MELHERLAREGKIAQLKKEMLALRIRIRNKQNTIRGAVSPTHTFEQLEEHLEGLQAVVVEYASEWSAYREARDHLKQLEEG